MRMYCDLLRTPFVTTVTRAQPWGKTPVAGGMYVPDRWVYFATIINWESDSEADPETAGAFGAAAANAFSLVVDALGD